MFISLSSITEKLSELGYEEELKKLPLYHTQKTHVAGMILFRDHPHVKISKPLTDRSNVSLHRAYCSSLTS